MKIGDLVRTDIKSTDHETYEEPASKIAMIVEGPNAVGKIKLLLPNGTTVWKHAEEVEYMPREGKYLQK